MKIFGQVLDSDNQPMSLADITIVTREEANKISEQSDLDGNFVLENELILPDSEFKISYIGYISQTLKAKELQGNKIKLLLDVDILDDLLINSVLEGKPKDNNIKESSVNKDKFVEHLQNHRFIYGGLGVLAGVLLILRSLRKK